MTVAGADTTQLAGWLGAVRAELRARESERDVRSGAALYREIFDCLDESAVAFSPDDRYLTGNRAYHRRYPHLGPDGELAGRTFTQIVRYAMEAGSILEKQAVEDPEGYLARRLYQLRQPDGTSSERLNNDGSWDLTRIILTAHGFRLSIRSDVTEQKRTQEELRGALDRLEMEGAQRAAFVAKLSHELRTPLTAILGYAGMIEGEVVGPVGADRYRGYAASIVQAGQRLLDLVNQILQLSRLEAGRMEVSDSTVDLVDLLRREITVVEPTARDNGTLLALDLPRDFPRLRADPRLVRQMLLNLLTNAVRFTRQGAVAVSLTQRADGGIDVRIADNGVGMTSAVLARAGEPYFHGMPPASGGEGGSGLGLAVVKELAALHQGWLQLVSAPGEGTVATLSFPSDRTVQAVAVA
ncbi:hypothetical protein STAQ_43560 [Allostella sp. ATCC 35155]|nr:hypothetical protein STAQ_43560 [Stella sp. ATCC 35155]